MTRFGAHAFIWESSWTPASARNVIVAAAAAGLDFVEIPLLRLETFDPVETRAMLDDHGLAATTSLGLPADATLPDHPAAAEAFLERVLPMVAAVGSPVLTGVIYGTLGVLPGRAATEAERDTVARTLKRVARTAQTLGVRLGIEPVNRYENHIINTAAQALELLAAIDEPNVFLHLDTYHMNIEEKGFRAPIEAAGGLLQYIHLSESDRGTPGTGNVHWDDVFTGLQAVGYGGDLVMESFVAVNPDIARATCMWRTVAPSSDVLVRDGLSFLRRLAKAHSLDGATPRT